VIWPAVQLITDGCCSVTNFGEYYGEFSDHTRQRPYLLSVRFQACKQEELCVALEDLCLT